MLFSIGMKLQCGKCLMMAAIDVVALATHTY